MPTLTQMKTDVDTFVTNKWPSIVAKQENFRTNRGTYWQGLPTHLSCPAHTNGTDGSSIGDNLDANPTDQLSSWLNQFPDWVSELLPACLRVDVYDGPSGKGWTLTAEATHDGRLFRRIVNVGPESHREIPWTEIIPDEG
jgi:hypothetical protein